MNFVQFFTDLFSDEENIYNYSAMYRMMLRENYSLGCFKSVDDGYEIVGLHILFVETPMEKTSSV